MKTFFKELFEYGHHCNQQLAAAFYNNPDKTAEKAVRLYNHVLNAHQIWNNRIHPLHPTFGVWELHPQQDWQQIEQSNYEQSLLILDTFDLDTVIHYTNTKNQAFSDRLRDILFHVVNHSTYHRAQIATEFRNSGLEPLATDYILYKRGSTNLR